MIGKVQRAQVMDRNTLVKNLTMNRYFTFIFVCLFEFSTAQNKTSQLDQMQGVWGNIMNAMSKSENAFMIIKGKTSLSFTHSLNMNDLDFPLSESIKGFQDARAEDLDSIDVNVLEESGRYYTVILSKNNISKEGWARNAFLLTPEYFECDGNVMSINGGQLVEYGKLDRLPNLTLSLLFDRGRRDKSDYIKKYLDIQVKRISATKSHIYSQPGKVTGMYLIKGDAITILEETKDWLKIEYNGTKLIQGWIKKKDTA